MEAFFNPSISKIKDIVMDQIKKANANMKNGKKISVEFPLHDNSRLAHAKCCR